MAADVSVDIAIDIATPPVVEIIGTTPLPDLGLAREQIPAAVQTATSRDMARSGALNFSDFLNRSLGSVHVNDVQGNPFMNDVNYRGYTASPLLGTPQGLSVYMDGVRLNQPFGDVVMWDLIPKDAISSLTLMSGANPLFGLNTLGGALSLQTKDGLHDAGTAVEIGAGRYGRRSLGLEHGGTNERGLDWFMVAHAYQEDGWRDDSPSSLGQFFGKLGWHDSKTGLKLSYAWAGSKMTGNGSQEQQLLANNYASVYTKPDVTRNHAGFVNLEAKSSLSEHVLLAGNVYYRNTRTATINGDLNEDALGESAYYTGQAADKAWLLAHGYSPVVESSNSRTSTTNAFPVWRCIAQAGTNTEPNEKCTGLITNTNTHQQNYGVSAQLSFQSKAAGYGNQFVVGAGYDASRTRFSQASQFGYLNADRSISPVNAYADGTQNSENAFDQRVNLSGQTTTWSLSGSDTLSLDDRWHITASGRYNSTALKNTDRLYPYNNATTQGGQRGSLDGDHTFRRFNPALGISFTPDTAINAYLGYSESSRAPTSIELGCADPDFGCRLPNSMAGDPALKQVVSKTWEAGLRGKLPGKLVDKMAWNVGVFRGDNLDDILFVANSAATGYFKNFGQTRRQGLEAGISGELDNASFGLNYTWMKATYQSSDSLGAQYNSAANASGNITVKPGDQIPLIPQQIFKAHANYEFDTRYSAGIELLAVGKSFLRGNENNAHVADGINKLGSGSMPGYTVVNLSGSYRPTAQLKLLINISNLFDQRYYTAGQLGPHAITANGGYSNSDAKGTNFYTPSAPRMIWVGLRYSLGATARD
ncbi:TonB-dependent receptor [Undibacterium sp. CY18W]|uniref:TonB-dependent receptor n=2 Tax=Undibacterium hunanense TaxID=2762292 RepID=A0ABR6ZM33_9BURK|nr:TonB-dependent receptor [Undibacterium hunanense]